MPVFCSLTNWTQIRYNKICLGTTQNKNAIFSRAYGLMWLKSLFLWHKIFRCLGIMRIWYWNVMHISLEICLRQFARFTLEKYEYFKCKIKKKKFVNIYNKNACHTVGFLFILESVILNHQGFKFTHTHTLYIFTRKTACNDNR